MVAVGDLSQEGPIGSCSVTLLFNNIDGAAACAAHRLDAGVTK